MRIRPRGRKQWVWLVVRWLIILTLVLTACAYMVGMPGRSYFGPLNHLTPEETMMRDNLKSHVWTLAGEIGARSITRYEGLNAASAYIEAEFRKQGYEVSEQVYQVNGVSVRNIEVEIRGSRRPDQIVIIGAHYDSVEDCPGANDNASGVAGLIEIARIFKESKPSKTIRFVAFVNEEPPYFQTENMGSVVYANRCHARKENIVSMLSLETIGCYSDAPNSQKYPFPFSLLYPHTGNFIGFVGNLSSRSLTQRAIANFRENTRFPSEGVSAPGWITGIGWSDQWSFWRRGYPGVMVTDTAPFRYKQYHSLEDTPDKLDYDRTATVVSGLVRVVSELSGPND